MFDLVVYAFVMIALGLLAFGVSMVIAVRAGTSRVDFLYDACRLIAVPAIIVFVLQIFVALIFVVNLYFISILVEELIKARAINISRNRILYAFNFGLCFGGIEILLMKSTSYLVFGYNFGQDYIENVISLYSMVVALIFHGATGAFYCIVSKRFSSKVMWIAVFIIWPIHLAYNFAIDYLSKQNNLPQEFFSISLLAIGFLATMISIYKSLQLRELRGH